MLQSEASASPAACSESADSSSQKLVLSAYVNSTFVVLPSLVYTCVLVLHVAVAIGTKGNEVKACG